MVFLLPRNQFHSELKSQVLHIQCDECIDSLIELFSKPQEPLKPIARPCKIIVGPYDISSFCKELSLVWVCAAGYGEILTTDLAHRINCLMSTITKGKRDTVYAAKSSTKISHNI